MAAVNMDSCRSTESNLVLQIAAMSVESEQKHRHESN